MTSANKKNNIGFAVILLIVSLFTAVWAYFAATMPSWSDELSHTSTAKGLMVSGQPLEWSFHQNKMTDTPYTRGMIVTRLVKAAFETWGVTLFSSRVVPFLFTMLSFLIFIFYLRGRQQASIETLLLTTIFFFTQSMVLEHAFYARVYAPLGFCVVLNLILLWESHHYLRLSRYLNATLLFAACLVPLSIATFDGWHYVQLPIFFMGMVLLPLFHEPKIRRSLELWIETHRKRLTYLSVFIFLSLPLFVRLEGHMLADMRYGVGGRIVGNTFKTYADNIFGTLRMIWALNIGFFFFCWNLKQKKNIEYNFQTWIFWIGVTTATILGLCGHTNLIFYSRYFYASVLIASLGMPVILKPFRANPYRLKWLVVLYVFLNLNLSFVNFYFDRSNIDKPISWLTTHIKPSDALISYASVLALHGGESLVPRNIVVEASRNIDMVEQFKKEVEKTPGETVYYLYDHFYRFREFFDQHAFVKARVDSKNDLYRFLRDVPPGEQVLTGLRNCGLKKFKKSELLASLQWYLDYLRSPAAQELEKKPNTFKSFFKKLF